MSDLFGIIATFQEPQAITRAAAVLRQSNFDGLEAYTPYPMEELSDIIRPRRRSLLPLIMFLAAIGGAALGYWIQYWGEALSYPLNVGGRPYNSWPAFTVSTFEIMLLSAVAAGFIGLIVASRLLLLYHPLFNAESFQRASRDRFILCIENKDERFDADSLRQSFEQLGAVSIEEVRT